MTLEEFYIIIKKDFANFIIKYKKGIKEDPENFPEILCEDEWFNKYRMWLHWNNF